MVDRSTRSAVRRRTRPDIFMVGYNEPNLGDNWARLQSIAPTARLVEGIPGIYAAYRRCASLAETTSFFVVDGDNYVLDGFGFGVPRLQFRLDLFVWFARNPINGLEYGHGGIKLFTRAMFRDATAPLAADVSTALAERTFGIAIVASEHRYNTDPYRTWSVAFRECVKLAQPRQEQEQRQKADAMLNVWTDKASDAAFASFSIAGAKAGKQYGLEHAGDKEALAIIHDATWLRAQFQADCPEFAGKTADGSACS